jgi:hypothetical protein
VVAELREWFMANSTASQRWSSVDNLR